MGEEREENFTEEISSITKSLGFSVVETGFKPVSTF